MVWFFDPWSSSSVLLFHFPTRRPNALLKCMEQAGLLTAASRFNGVGMNHNPERSANSCCDFNVRRDFFVRTCWVCNFAIWSQRPATGSIPLCATSEQRSSPFQRSSKLPVVFHKIGWDQSAEMMLPLIPVFRPPNLNNWLNEVPMMPSSGIVHATKAFRK
jgi:hypothetical protein